MGSVGHRRHPTLGWPDTAHDPAPRGGGGESLNDREHAGRSRADAARARPGDLPSPPGADPTADPSVVERLLAQEWERFETWSAGSGEHNKRASESLPLGVTSSFQHWDPYPISVASARGAWLTDVDGNRMLDLSMGFGAMLVGHLNPAVECRRHRRADGNGHAVRDPLRPRRRR